MDYLINNALPIMKGIDACSYEEFQYALSVGVTASFYLTKLLAPHFAPGASVMDAAERTSMGDEIRNCPAALNLHLVPRDQKIASLTKRHDGIHLYYSFRHVMRPVPARRSSASGFSPNYPEKLRISMETAEACKGL